MYTEGPEMNFFTESLDLPQKEQRRCLSLGIGYFESARNTTPSRGAGAPRERERLPVFLARVAHFHHLPLVLDHVVDQPVLQGLLRAHEAVAVHILDRKSTRLNSSHVKISYAVFCLKKKTLCTHN